MSVRFNGTLGPVEFRFPNGHCLIMRDDASALLYDNNGRAVSITKGPLDASEWQRLMTYAAFCERVEPQVRIAPRPTIYRPPRIDR